MLDPLQVSGRLLDVEVPHILPQERRDRAPARRRDDGLGLPHPDELVRAAWPRAVGLMVMVMKMVY